VFSLQDRLSSLVSLISVSKTHLELFEILLANHKTPESKYTHSAVFLVLLEVQGGKESLPLTSKIYLEVVNERVIEIC
jgi:hypothetical protein